jgi:signal transduction protein with GAF and PtsI domain
MTATLTNILKQICLSMGWKYGEAWFPEEDVLRCHEAYYMASPELATFRQESEAFTFAAGAGLPGRVWTLKEPEWIENVSEQPAIYYRSHIAKLMGLKAGVGVPILEGDQVTLILVFYSDQIQPANEDLIANLLKQIQLLIVP